MFTFIFILIVFFVMFDAINIKWGQRVVAAFGLSIVLILFAGLRYDTRVPDYLAYWDGFEDILEHGLDYSRLSGGTILFEPGYNFVVYLSTLIGDSAVIMFILVAAIAVSITISSYVKYTPYFLVAILFYYVHTYLYREQIQIRAAIAAAICLYSLRYVYKEQLSRFIITMIVAMSFHLAAVGFFIVYWFYSRNFSRKTWIVLVLTSFVIALIMPLGKLLTMLPLDGIFNRIQTYAWMVGEGQELGVFTPTTIKQMFVVFIGFKYWDILSERCKYFKVMFIPLIISLCWLMLWNDFAIIAGRVGTFFSVTEVVIMSYFMVLVDSKSRPLMVVLLIIVAYLIFYLNMQKMDAYRSVFEIM